MNNYLNIVLREVPKAKPTTTVSAISYVPVPVYRTSKRGQQIFKKFFLWRHERWKGQRSYRKIPVYAVAKGMEHMFATGTNIRLQ